MTHHHPDFQQEQDHIDLAYECLEHTRSAAWKLRDLNEADLGGTFQARFERNAFDEALVRRLEDLELGDAALVFGRIDRVRTTEIQETTEVWPYPAGGVDSAGEMDLAGELDTDVDAASSTADDELSTEAFHIGRLAVADEDSNPIVVDWRAPVAEPFYRATGREPMGLARRRHLAVEGRRLLGVEDELFGEGHLGIGHDEGLDDQGVSSGRELRGYSSLMAALGKGRTGTLGDIVATIQAEQDEIIRSPQAGVMVVQGGPGTGKTVVALHRAAYLLYTYRFPLEDQGVLVLGPNRVFMRYIQQVLPSLGEAGIDQVVLADLVPGVVFQAGPTSDSPATERLKGDPRMSDLIDQAIIDRERPLREDLVVPYGSGFVRLTVEESRRIVVAARRRFRRHNSGRKWFENEFWNALADSYRSGGISPKELRSDLRRHLEVRRALERMWPLLTPAQLLHDLFGSMGLLRLASDGTLTADEYRLLHRHRSDSVDEVRWTPADVALLDDAREALGPVPGRGGEIDPADEIRTYGHIVIDEVQDLTPMQLRMAARRSLNGSMTVVGDIAQATGPYAPTSWEDVTEYLPQKVPARVVGLSVGYRIPYQIMELATPVMEAATPGLRVPSSVRVGAHDPEIIEVVDLNDGAIAAVRRLRNEHDFGSIAVVALDGRCDSLSAAFDRVGLEHSRARGGLADDLSVVPVSLVKGLELDAVVVVEPSEIVAATEYGMRSLYVTLTRPTQSLSVVHRDELPEPLRVSTRAPVNSSR